MPASSAGCLTSSRWTGMPGVQKIDRDARAHRASADHRARDFTAQWRASGNVVDPRGGALRKEQVTQRARNPAH